MWQKLRVHKLTYNLLDNLGWWLSTCLQPTIVSWWSQWVIVVAHHYYFVMKMMGIKFLGNSLKDMSSLIVILPSNTLLLWRFLSAISLIYCLITTYMEKCRISWCVYIRILMLLQFSTRLVPLKVMIWSLFCVPCDLCVVSLSFSSFLVQFFFGFSCFLILVSSCFPRLSPSLLWLVKLANIAESSYYYYSCDENSIHWLTNDWPLPIAWSWSSHQGYIIIGVL
jgi:hypothetical protein